jgi:predicted transcriptional regulator
MNITFYKYRITNRDTKECKLCFQYEDVKKFSNIPRSTLYRIFNGESKNKYLKKFKFEKVRIPREDVSAVY